MDFWLPYLSLSAEKIRLKLITLGCNFPPANDPNNGFNIFGFIDNNILSTARPGSGPVRDGVGAGRKDKLIQEAFYVGWKKTHGLKFQTVDLANGMNFHVFGPKSAVRHDIMMLQDSELNNRCNLAALQRFQPLQFCAYGDSAYVVCNESHIIARHQDEVGPLSIREKLENAKLSSARQVIEWHYGDLQRLWKFIDCKKGLRLIDMPVARSYLVSVILRNAYVCFNSCNTGVYFNMIAPTLQVWTSQGPREMNG